MKDLFVWTECFNCPELARPLLESLLKHNPGLEINVFCFEHEIARVKKVLNSRVQAPGKNFMLNLLRRNERSIFSGYAKKGHLGTARAWTNVMQSNPAKYYIHLDSDQIFLSDLLTEVISKLKEGFDLVGTRRPYFHRGYRKIGRDGARLDKLEDSINTDLIGFSRKAIGNLWSPITVRKIRGRRTSFKPVVDFFDPIFFDARRRGCRVFYLDSQDESSVGQTEVSSRFYEDRIVFSAVGSGANFWRNPQSISSPTYREYALRSYSLWRKWIEMSPIPYETLDAPDLVSRLKRLNQDSWTLESA